MLKQKSFLEKEYIQRINQALKYIDDNIGSNLSVDIIAQEAYYSPFHFHRLFKAIMGEPVNSYVNRQRIERTALQLIHQRSRTITEIANEFGFSSNSSFSKAFRKHYGLSPTQFRLKNPSRYSKIGQLDSKNGQKVFLFEKHICNIEDHLNWIAMNSKIEVRETPSLNLAAITQIGIEGIEDTFDRLIKWAKPEGFMESDSAKLVRVFHDSFKITAPEKVRMSIGLTMSDTFEEAGEIISVPISKDKRIIGHFEIAPMEFEKAWDGLFVWMNENGYKKAVGTPFELYHNDFRTHPKGKCLVDFHIPVE